MLNAPRLKLHKKLGKPLPNLLGESLFPASRSIATRYDKFGAIFSALPPSQRSSPITPIEPES
ncbi:MAG: hypothetical protein AB7H90_05065 [Alphaproteobacteria bacterium]